MLSNLKLNNPFVIAIISAIIVYIYMYMSSRREKTINNMLNIKLAVIVGVIVLGAIMFIQRSNLVGGYIAEPMMSQDIFLSQPN